MMLYYKKYGLSLKKVAPFFKPDKMDNFDYDKEIHKLLSSSGTIDRQIAEAKRNFIIEK